MSEQSKQHNSGEKENRPFFKTQNGLATIIISVLLVGLAAANASSSKNQTDNKKIVTQNASRSQTVKASTKTAVKPATPAPPPLTVSQKNAVRKAKSYLSYTAFSRDGLVTQLEFEKFSPEDSVYGADHSGADWMEQAAKKAKSYMEISAFSRESLITQLQYEKFTPEQASHGADSVGL